jgi:FtsZ-binding cell division protein ZapB
MYKQHPLSAAFPAMQANDFQALKDSIENIGVQNPVTLFEGMVIDGWHRYTAANELGMDCPTVELGDVDPRDFVLAQNKARRHITQAQLAAATTSVYAWHPSNGDGQRGGVALSAAPLKTNAEMAAIAGVSERTIRQAKAVQTHAAPEVIEAVKAGSIGLPKAAIIAQLPKEEQAAAIAKPVKKAKPALVAVPEPQDAHELDDAAEVIRELATENEQLRDKLATGQMDTSEEAKAEASNIIADLREQVKTLEIALDAVKASRDGFQRENAELKKQVAMYQRQLKKAVA